MIGVVLWSCVQDLKAVIWCEDQGDLAILVGSECSSCADGQLSPGDLLRFDISQDSKVRKAVNARLVAQDQYPTLAHDLREAVRMPATNLPASPAPDRPRGQVIAFRASDAPRHRRTEVPGYGRSATRA